MEKYFANVKTLPYVRPVVEAIPLARFRPPSLPFPPIPPKPRGEV